MSVFAAEQMAMAAKIIAACRDGHLILSSAESCTGGLIAACITEVPGSSVAFDRGFVTYSNIAKQEMLGVSAATLNTFGAVSKETALEMAQGALARSSAHIAISVTGIAGPGGGSSEKPVGLVCFAAASRSGLIIQRDRRFGDIGRSDVRHMALDAGLQLTSELLDALA
jgi:nicotinamide-nucleotide amidase